MRDVRTLRSIRVVRWVVLALTAGTLLLKPGLVFAAFGDRSQKVTMGPLGCIQMLFGIAD